MNPMSSPLQSALTRCKVDPNKSGLYEVQLERAADQYHHDVKLEAYRAEIGSRVSYKDRRATMIGEKVGSMTLQETGKPMDSGKYGLPAMDTHNRGSGTLLGHDVQAQGAFTAHMRPDGSWVGHAHAGVVMCAEGMATFKADGVGNMTEEGGVSFRGGAIFETTSEAFSELNGKYCMFTYEADPEGKAVWELYPCK